MFRNRLNSIFTTCVPLTSFGINNPNHAFRFHASAAITMYAQLLSKSLTGLLIASPIRQLHYLLCRPIPQRRYIKKVSNVIYQSLLSLFYTQILFQHNYPIHLIAFPRLIFKFRYSFTLQPYVLISLLFDYFLFYAFRFLPLLCFYRVFRFTYQYLPCILRQFFRTFY